MVVLIFWDNRTFVLREFAVHAEPKSEERRYAKMLISGPGKIADVDSLHVSAKESAKGVQVATTNEKDNFASIFDRGLNLQKTDSVVSERAQMGREMPRAVNATDSYGKLLVDSKCRNKVGQRIDVRC